MWHYFCLRPFNSVHVYSNLWANFRGTIVSLNNIFWSNNVKLFTMELSFCALPLILLCNVFKLLFAITHFFFFNSLELRSKKHQIYRCLDTKFCYVIHEEKKLKYWRIRGKMKPHVQAIKSHMALVSRHRHHCTKPERQTNLPNKRFIFWKKKKKKNLKCTTILQNSNFGRGRDFWKCSLTF